MLLCKSVQLQISPGGRGYTSPFTFFGWEDCLSSGQKLGAIQVCSDLCLAARSPQGLFKLPEVTVEEWVTICLRQKTHEVSAYQQPLWNCSNHPLPPLRLNKGNHYVALATGLQMNRFAGDKITDSTAKYSPEYLTSTTQFECTRIFIVVSLPLHS